MNSEILVNVKWNDKKLLFRSTLIGLLFCGVLLAMGEYAKPPEGHVFEKLPSVRGIYQCCGSGGRTSWSQVGTTPAICNRFDYFPAIGGGWFDCGYKEQLNGRIVEIEQTVVPKLYSDEANPVVVKLSSDGVTYLEYSNQRIRELWIGGMRSGALSIALIISFLVHAFQLIYFNRKNK
jgi:hypothetical protein